MNRYSVIVLSIQIGYHIPIMDRPVDPTLPRFGTLNPGEHFSNEACTIGAKSIIRTDHGGSLKTTSLLARNQMTLQVAITG